LTRIDGGLIPQMELPGGGRSGFDPPASSIDRMVKESAIGIFAMSKSVAKKYKN
jgi:hypothetical protein